MQDPSSGGRSRRCTGSSRARAAEVLDLAEQLGAKQPGAAFELGDGPPLKG